MWSSSLTTWPNNEFRLPAMTSRTQRRPVRSTTSVFLTKSCQRIPRIIRYERMRKTSSFRRSSCRSVHVSEPYNKMDSIQVLVQAKFCLQLKPGLYSVRLTKNKQTKCHYSVTCFDRLSSIHHTVCSVLATREITPAKRDVITVVIDQTVTLD